MGPKRPAGIAAEKMPAKKILTQEGKLAMIKKLDHGKHPASITQSYSMNNFSICTIWNNVEKIKEAIAKASSISSKSTSYVQSPLLEMMEKLLSVWLEDQNQKPVPITCIIIKEKVRLLYQHLEQTIKPFEASKG